MLPTDALKNQVSGAMSVSPKIDSITWELTSDIAASSESGVQFSEAIQILDTLSESSD
ncbi:hypothetical protein OSCI_20006 [Kamptonema sp. PCC 6506]|nr:hypothetical protein OSCI_20006 [Kamptonema sp. PCC 6506]